MFIDSLWLINFRSHENNTYKFKKNTIVIGKNGVGKTSILEAIDLLATTRSNITKNTQHCIRTGTAGFLITAQFQKQNEKLNIVCKQDKQKTIKVNDEILKKSSALIGLVNTVLFLPQDIDLIQGSPAIRRRYLDVIISQTDKQYYQILQLYYAVLKQRNELLKKIKHKQLDPAELAVWDEQLSGYHALLFKKRTTVIKIIAQSVQELYLELHTTGRICFNYRDTEDLRTALQAERDDDIRTGHTHSGIHSADFDLVINDRHYVREYCSQGQQRLISIAIKCAETQLKYDAHQDPPIVLIDDVLLELDLQRFNQIIEKITPECQKIFTVTDLSRFSVNKNMHTIEL